MYPEQLKKRKNYKIKRKARSEEEAVFANSNNRENLAEKCRTL